MHFSRRICVKRSERLIELERIASGVAKPGWFKRAGCIARMCYIMTQTISVSMASETTSGQPFLATGFGHVKNGWRIKRRPFFISELLGCYHLDHIRPFRMIVGVNNLHL